MPGRAVLPLLSVTALIVSACGIGPPAPTAKPSGSAVAGASVAPGGTAAPVASDAGPNPLESPPDLSLKSLDVGAECPHSVIRSIVPGMAPALGPGPATPIGPFDNGVLAVSGLGDNAAISVTWAVAPSYSGPLLIRGHELNGNGTVRFGVGSTTSAGQLRLPSGGGTPIQDAPGWRTWDTVMSVSHPGCYGFQVDGIGFTTNAYFEAR